MATKIKIQAFLKNERIRSEEAANIHSLVKTLRGEIVDEVQLNVIIKNKNDIELLNNLLNDITPCFK